MKQLILTFVVFLLGPSVCFAQAAKKIPVAVSLNGHDQLGQSFAFALKEAIRGSQSFFLIDHDTLPKNPRMVIYLVSIDTFMEKGLWSAIGVSFVYDSVETPGNGIFLSSALSHCPSNQVQSCARQVLPSIDSMVEYLRKTWPSLWKTL
jgi:hypothetical protein